MFKDCKELLRLALPLIPAGLIGTLNPLIDQYFAAKLGQEFLRIHIFIDYICLIFTTLGPIFGHSLLISMNNTPKMRDEYFSSSLGLSIIIVAIFFSSLVFLMKPYFQLTQIPLTQYSAFYFFFLCFASGFLFIQTLITYFFIGLKKTKMILGISFLFFMINALGNFLAYIYFPKEYKFIGLSFSTFISSLLAVSFQLLILYKIKIKWNLQSPMLFLKRCRRMLSWDSLSMILSILTPFIISLIFQKYAQSEVTFFNIILKIDRILMISLFALFVAAVPWMREMREVSGKVRLDHQGHSLLFSGLILYIPLVVIIFLNLNEILIAFFQSHPLSSEMTLAAMVFLSQGLLFCFSLKYLLNLKLKEKSHVLAKIDILVQYGYLIPTVFLGVHFHFSLMKIFIISFLPSSFGKLFLLKFSQLIRNLDKEIVSISQ